MVRARREIEPGKVIETEERGCTLASKVKVVERPFKEVTSELRLECENGARHEKIMGKRVPIRRNRKHKNLDTVLAWPVPGQKKSEWLGLEKEVGIAGSKVGEASSGQIM